MNKDFGVDILNSVKAINEVLGSMGNYDKKKSKIIKFDTSTSSPWEIIVSERGFSINGVRLSFEMIETAISKDIFLTLDSGNGLVLDLVKMQKILKYKNE